MVSFYNLAQKILNNTRWRKILLNSIVCANTKRARNMQNMADNEKIIPEGIM